jgi:hypothetical protein
MKQDDSKENSDSENNESSPNETGQLELSGFIKITDPNTGEVLLNQRIE